MERVGGLRARRRGRWHKVGVLIWLAASLYGTAAPCIGRPVLLADLEKLSALPDVSIDGAPDGTMLALGLNGRVILLDLERAGAETDLGPGFGPAWAPNSHRLAFYSKRSGALQLWIWDRGSGRFTEMTHDVKGLDVDPSTSGAGRTLDAFRIAWSPDARHLAFASRLVTRVELTSPKRASPRAGHSAKAPIVLTDSTPAGLTLRGVLVHPGTASGVPFSDDGTAIEFRPGRDSQTQIRLIDVPGGAERWITGGAYSHFDPAWSPDGRLIACVSVQGAGMTGQTRETELDVLDLPSGALREITSGGGVKETPVWMTAHTLTYMQSSRTFTWTTAYTLSVDGDQRPMAMHLLDRRIMKLLWSGPTGSFLASYKDGVSTPLASISLHSAPRILTRARYPLEVSDFTTLGSGAVAWVQSDPQDLWTLRYLDGSAREPVTLLRLTHAPPGLEFGRVETVRWRNRRGERLEGTILFPPRFSRGIRYPLIVDAYPLMPGGDWTSPMFGNYAWADAGYVIFRPSPPAPHVWDNPWKSEASSAVAKGPGGWAITVDDVMSGIDHLVAQGIVDPDRMCLYGFSNGGGVVDYLVTRIHRFRCAVVISPAMSDWVRPFLLSAQEQVSWLDDGKRLESGLSDYIALSAVFHLSSVRTPMLLAAGDKDGDFLLDAIEMYNRLRRLGSEVTLVRYPDQEHGFTGAAMEDFWAREMAFFAQYLKPHPRPGGVSKTRFVAHRDRSTYFATPRLR